jgi:CSLREA domain-containing protein
MRWRVWLGIGLTGVALGVWSASAGAATITVNTTVDEIENNVNCALREAVIAANINASFGGCPGDTVGADTIILQAGQTYKLTRHGVEDDVTGTTGLGDLDIAGQLTIQSAGSGLATIDADSTTASVPVANKDRVIDVLPEAGAVTLIRLLIQNGQVAAGPGGGGIRTRSALTVTDSEVTGNVDGVLGGGSTAFHGGGGIITRNGATSQGSLTVTGSTIAGNSTLEGADSDGAEGGGIFHAGSGALTVTNSTISGNTATDLAGMGTNESRGAGISSFTEGTLTNVTVANNQVVAEAGEGQGGGTSTFASDPLTISGTIISANTAPSGPDCAGVLTSTGGNVIGNTTGCTVNPAANDAFDDPANLGLLVNNGGPTRTHALNPGSPAIDRGGSCPVTDQRGFFRAPVAPCDAGAFEVGAPATPPVEPPPEGAPPGDTTPSETTITEGPKDKTKKKTATFEFGSSEPGSTFACQLDGQETFKPCTSPTTVKVKKGKHTFEVVATDAAGNADPTPARDTWKVKKKKKKK